MKNIKKLLSIVMVLAMVLSLGVQALAATDSADITIDDANGDGSTYKAYQLLFLTTTSGANPSDGDRDELGYAYTVNPKYEAILKAVTGKENAPDPAKAPSEVSRIVTYIQSLTEVDAIRAFADKVFAAIEAAKDPAIEPDKTITNSKTFADMPQGYYLIVEELGKGSTAVRSLVMLDTAGQNDITIKTKEDKPKLEKDIVEDGKLLDNTLADLGKVITFQLTATLPSNYTNFKEYYMQFVDTMSDGLTLLKDTFTIQYGEGTTAVKVPESEIVTQDGDDNDFTYTIPNLKKVDGVMMENGGKVILTYSVKVNDDAVVRNPNDAYLKYSNDPYFEGEGDPTSPTPPDTAVVFTFFINGDKVNGDDNNSALAGAGFTLYKKGDAPNGEKTIKHDGATYYVYRAESEATLNEETGKAEFGFNQLNEGEYLLVETKVPAGFNKALDIEFEVKVEKDPLTGNVTSAEVFKDGVKDESFDFEVKTPTTSEGKGTVDVTVKNNSGLELPETGGIGTTIFYVVGAVLVVGAVILLVTRKRVSGEEK